ncbi:MAG: chemotaxis protein CheA [Gemmatimonadaceae bacterium]
MPGDTFDEFVEDYFAECDEHLSAIRRLLGNAEARSPRVFHPVEFDDIARRLETIRALSKIVELVPAEELAKTLSDVLRETTEPGSVVSKDVLDLLFAGVGLLDRSIQSKRGWHPVPDHRAFIAGVRDFLRRRPEVHATAVVQTAPVAAELADVEMEDDSRRVALVPAPRPRDGGSATEASVVRVDVGTLDDVMRSVAELVLLRARIDESLRGGGASGGVVHDTLRSTNRALERQLRALRESVTRMRRVSIAVLFEQLRVIAQEMLRGSGRTVRLQFGGTETSIDVDLVERLLDPLLHLVRIAALHDIEDRSARLARGKPAEGTITVRARTSTGWVALEVEDDGAGEYFGDAPAARAGMSTVHSAITGLGGELSLSSAPWRGTKFTIELPIKEAVSDALLVTVGDQVMAVPLLSLREVLRLDPSTITSLAGGEVVAYRGSALSLLTLHRHFGIARATDARAHVLVVQRAARRLGLVVDGVIGIREIVERPVSDPRVAARGVAGATELGDGRLALIIDTAALIRNRNS